MKKKFTFLMTAMALIFAMMTPRGAWGQTESVTYVFNFKDWKAKIGETNANWTSKKDGSQFTQNQGIQVTTSATGACGNSNVAYSNVSKIVVTYCTNASKGAGSINWYNVEATTSAAQSGTLAGSYTVTKPSSGGTTLRTCEIIPSSAQTGFVQLYVECDANSIYIWSVEIQYTSGPSTTPACTIDPTEWDFGNVEIGEQTQKTFTVTTANLTEDLTLTVSEGFSVSPATIESTETETTVTVTCAPTAVGALNGTLTISGGGLTDDVTATLSATGIGSEQYTITYSAANGTAPEAQQVTQGSSVTLPTINDVDCNTWQFAGWSESENSTEAPTLMAGDEYTPEADVTLYAVYKKQTGSETADYTLQYDTWTYSGTTTDKSSYRLFGDGAYIESAESHDLSNVTAVKITMRTFGGGDYKNVNIEDANGNVWGNAVATSNSLTEITATKTGSLAGNGKLRIKSKSGNGTDKGVGIKKVVYTVNNASYSYTTNPDCSTPVATPTITPNGGEFIGSQEITLACTTEGATISYTTDDWENSNNYSTPFTITATTTLKVKATKEGMSESEEASATFTKIQALETIQAIFDASATAGNYYVTFNNWVVSGVNGSNAYVTDGTKGFIVYKSGHGFEVGNILSGTAQLALTRYNGAAEFTNLTATTQGISVAEGGSVSPVTMTIDQITSGVYTGAVITIENVTYNSSDESLSDGTNTIKPYNKLYSEMSFTNDKEYNVTGVYLQYNNTKEIMPRNAEDIYLIPATEYNIELIQPLLGGGTISADKDKAAAGETVTLTATPFEHYHLYEWKVLYGTVEEVTVTYNQFTMPASDVRIFAYFAEDDKYSAAYYYNGTFLHYSAQTYAGPIGTLYDPTTDMTPPAGFSFVGWSTSMASTEPIDETYTISSDIDLYAIFEKESTSRDGSEDSFVKVTEAPEDWSGEYLLVYEGGESNGVPVPAVAWTGVDADGCGAEVSITSNAIAEKPEAAATLTIAPMEGGYSIRVDGGDNDGKYIGRTADSNGLNFTSEAQLNTLAITDGEAVITAAGGRTMKYNYATNNLRFRYYGSGQQPVQLYKKQGSEPTANRRYTRVYDDAYPATGSLLSVEGPSIIVSDYILDIPSVDNDNPANLIIEDGAQLIHHNPGVAATLQKSINGYTGTNDHYYLIANPTDNATVANLTENNYDLYTFDPTQALEWHYEKESKTLTSGIGYLYANSGLVTLEFAGNLRSAADDMTIDLAYYVGEEDGHEFPGFNLVGNPFAHNLDISNMELLGEDVEIYPITSIYQISGDKVVATQNTAIAPCEGFFIQAPVAGELYFNAGSSRSEKSSVSDLKVEVKESTRSAQLLDRAYVNFSESRPMNKFYLNENSTRLYIPQNGEDFAVVMASAAEGEMPVNFKAEKNGTYTITVNTENVDAEYLHLIDNMTGADTDLLSTSSYTFDAKTSDYASRFKLVFGVKNDNEEMSQASSFAYINNGEIIISNEGRATLQVIDVLGRIISSEEINGECRISTNGLTAGLYILNLNGNVQKIVVR